MDRRTVLGSVSTAILTTLAGCSRSLIGDDTDTSSEEDYTTDTDAHDTPDLTEPCSVSSTPEADYPVFPSEITEENVETFAVDFEKRFAEATIKNQPNKKFGGFDGSTGNVHEKTKSGYFIEVTVSVDYAMARGDETGTDLGSETFNSWYYINSKFASRSDRDTSGSPPNSGWKTVACA
ncbi:hypothetical protein [Haloarcula pellucida]|nr:hypothetical protein [Halomicroarcula pellucida]MBX0347396.1 hypothetical protein [Halomicroarcula pellucida]